MIGIIGSYIEDYYNAKICFLVDWDHAGIKIWDTDVLKEYITDNKLDSRQEGFICERT
jgi:hypothetical protein